MQKTNGKPPLGLELKVMGKCGEWLDRLPTPGSRSRVATYLAEYARQAEFEGARPPAPVNGAYNDANRQTEIPEADPVEFGAG